MIDADVFVATMNVQSEMLVVTLNYGIGTCIWRLKRGTDRVSAHTDIGTS